MESRELWRVDLRNDREYSLDPSRNPLTAKGDLCRCPPAGRSRVDDHLGTKASGTVRDDCRLRHCPVGPPTRTEMMRRAFVSKSTDTPFWFADGRNFCTKPGVLPRRPSARFRSHPGPPLIGTRCPAS